MHVLLTLGTAELLPHHGSPTCRSKPGASARDVKQSVELLKFAAGFVPAASVRQRAGSQQGSKPHALPVQGFPDLAFNATGRADALRDLAFAYQVRWMLGNWLARITYCRSRGCCSVFVSSLPGCVMANLHLHKHSTHPRTGYQPSHHPIRGDEGCPV